MNAQATVLGIDLGTSELKVVLVSAAGEVLAAAQAPLALSAVQPGWSEQDPAAWVQALVAACGALRSRASQAYGEIQAIGLSGQMHGATLLDADDEVLRPCILWNDSRSSPQCARLEQSGPALHALAGNLAMPGFTAPKLMWLQEHEPEVFARVACVLLPKDYLRWWLSGAKVSDMSDAAGTLWLDVARRAWSPELLQASGMRLSQMPALVEGSQLSAHLQDPAARLLGLRTGVPIAGGAGDNAASAIGMGAIEPGDSFVSLGTSGVLFSVTDQHRPNVKDAVHAFCHAVPGRWHQMAVMLSAASALRWITQTTQYSSETALLTEVEALGREARASAPLFLPYLSGERTPHNDPAASGAFLGLRHSHGAAHMAWAVIEGVTFGLLDGLRALRAAGSRIESLHLVGGGARSPLWAQLLANALAMPVLLGAHSHVGAALGAARLAQLCLSGSSDAVALRRVCRAPPSQQRFAPQAAPAAPLTQRYALFRSSYPALRPWFQQAASIQHEMQRQTSSR